MPHARFCQTAAIDSIRSSIELTSRLSRRFSTRKGHGLGLQAGFGQNSVDHEAHDERVNASGVPARQNVDPG